MEEYLTCPKCDSDRNVTWEFPFLARCAICRTLWTIKGNKIERVKSVDCTDWMEAFNNNWAW